jgi:quinolinate synthase
MLNAQQLRKLKEQYPGVPVVTYVNSSAEVKAESDVCCTSSNAVKVVNSIESDTVIFGPDRNLGHYVSLHTDKKMIIWDGYCPTHHSLTPEDVDEARKKYPDALVLIHPEAQPQVLEKADFIGSTGQILHYVSQSRRKKFIIGTEQGILHTLKKQNPDKEFYLLSPKLLCQNMKKITLESVLFALEKLEPEVVVPEDIRLRAKKALDRMLEIV